MTKSRFLNRGGISTTIAIALMGGMITPSPAQAQIGAVKLTGFGGIRLGHSGMAGYIFDITQPVTVTGLSVYSMREEGLLSPHEVGLWNANGTLLSSTIVPAGTVASLDNTGQFRFVPVFPITLPIATGYRVGALYHYSNEFIIDTPEVGSGKIPAPGITYIGGATTDNPVFAFPADAEVNSGNPLQLFGLVGGSFVIAGNASSPEPGTLALLGAGLVGVILRRRIR